MKAAFYTFGCKVNQYETQSLAAQFESDGFMIAPFHEGCDVYVVNSCTVTAEGDHKARKLLRRLRREHPHAVLALTGCYAQAHAEIALLVPEADVITGTSNRAALLPAVRRALADRRALAEHCAPEAGERVIDIVPHRAGEVFEPLRLARFGERTRAFLKIQDGCERRCAYCIIPTARGPFRSRPLCEVRAELARLAAAEYREIVLVGINLSAYGVDQDTRLLDAVRAACATPGIERVRLSSLEPELLEPDTIRALGALPQFCPHFHLSLQSGCDATLTRMRRHYTAAMYRAIVEDIRAVFDNPAITTDVMVGFPQESEEEFAQSLAFCQALGLQKAHVFAYSRRPGTPADELDGQVPESVKAARSRRMIEACEETRGAFMQAQTGRVCRVLFEKRTRAGVCHGYSENYTPVCVEHREDLCGAIRSVRLTGVRDGCCTGELHDPG